MQNNIVEEIFDIGDIDERFYAIVGRADENLKKFTELFDIKIVARGQELYIKGESSKVGSFLEFLNYTTKEYAKSPLSSNDVLNMAISYTHQQTDENQIPQIDYETILITHRKKSHHTKNQKPKPLCKFYKTKRYRVWYRSSWHWQDLPCYGDGGFLSKSPKNKQNYTNKTSR
jgi:phosphate starvation-inducible protein PhoH